jgi:hypothetical protein
MKLKAIAILTIVTLSALIVTAFAAYSSSMTMRQSQNYMRGNNESGTTHCAGDMDEMHGNMEQMHNGMGEMRNQTSGQNQNRHGCH